MSLSASVRFLGFGIEAISTLSNRKLFICFFDGFDFPFLVAFPFTTFPVSGLVTLLPFLFSVLPLVVPPVSDIDRNRLSRDPGAAVFEAKLDARDGFCCFVEKVEVTDG